MREPCGTYERRSRRRGFENQVYRESLPEIRCREQIFQILTNQFKEISIWFECSSIQIWKYYARLDVCLKKYSINSKTQNFKIRSTHKVSSDSTHFYDESTRKLLVLFLNGSNLTEKLNYKNILIFIMT